MPTTRPDLALTGEHVHVLLDALTALDRYVVPNEPWQQYDAGDPDDPKTTREGYTGLVTEARDALTALLNGSTDTVVVTD